MGRNRKTGIRLVGDRALGAAYINGIWESLLKEEK